MRQYAACALLLVVTGCGAQAASPADAATILDGGARDGRGPEDVDATRDAGASSRADVHVGLDAARPGEEAGRDSGGIDSAGIDASVPVDAAADAQACATCARDWSRFPAVATLDGVAELWVVSDVHGDYAAFTKLLAAAGVITASPSSPQEVQWAAGHAALVIVGDLIDKGPDAPDAVRLTVALGASAQAAGGRVVATMGNHEAEFLADPTNSKATASDGLDPELQALGLTPDATAAGDDDIGRFVREMPFAARVDDWFFCHAGNTGGSTLGSLSGALQRGVDAAGFGAPVLSATDSLLETKLSKSGPQWWDATNDPTGLLTAWTAALGATHLVMGHQPGAVGFADGTTRPSDRMMAAFGGLLFLVDTGLSVGADDTGGALLHVTNAGLSSVAWEEVTPDGKVHAL